MKTDTFDFKAELEKLKGKFVPEILTQPQNREYWPATTAPHYRDELFRILMDYTKLKHQKKLNSLNFQFIAKQTEIGYQHWVNEDFKISGLVSLRNHITDFDHELICNKLDAHIKNQISQTPYLAEIICKSEVKPGQDKTDTFLYIGATIEPIPDNLAKYLQTVDLYVVAENWLRAAMAAREEQIKNNIEGIITLAKPDFSEVKNVN